MASCIHIEQLLQAYADGELTSAERLLVEEHLDSCTACMERLRVTRSTTALVFEVLHEDRLRRDLSSMVMGHLPEMTPVIVHEKPLLHGLPREDQARRWLRPILQLAPTFVLSLLFIMGMLLYTEWPAFNFDNEDNIGLVTFCDGSAVTGYVGGERQKTVRLREQITTGKTFQTQSDGHLLLGLKGPSLVTMFPGTRAEVQGYRDLMVKQGRVFLDVYRDGRQFRVQTPEGSVTVLGTSFQVEVKPGSTEVTVVSGEVRVENAANYVTLSRGAQAVFSASDAPRVRRGVNVDACLAEARAVRPNPAAEKYFLADANMMSAPVPNTTEQVFVVDTKHRPVSQLVLTWVPDPYTNGHVSYNVYVSDSAMTPLFKSVISGDQFKSKEVHSLHLNMPAEMHDRAMSALNITLMPDLASGSVETTFTEVTAIGALP